MARLVLLLLLGCAAADYPGVSLPFNAQVPPVARVSHAYRYRLAPSTFVSAGPSTVYSLSGSPPWMHFNGESQTLWGTPGSSDIGTAGFSITAAFPGGSFVMPGTLAVTDDPEPKVGDIPASLGGGKPGSGAISVTLQPSSPISIAVPKTVFTANSDELGYYAVMEDHTPLPSWISFDAKSLEFSGFTPQVQGEQEKFDILLIGSHTSGFEDVSIPLTLTIGENVHTLEFSPPAQTVHLSSGNPVNIHSLRDQLVLDGHPIQDSDIRSASAHLPPWLTFDENTFTITGQVPGIATSQDISIEVSDRLGDTAKATMHLAITSDVFTGQIGPCVVTRGEEFDCKIDQHLFASPGVSTSIAFKPPASWLHYNASGLSINGRVPLNANLDAIVATLTANTSDASASGSEDFRIVVQGGPSQSLTHPGLRTAAPSSTAGAFAPGSSDQSLASDAGNENPESTLIRAVVGTCVAVLIIVAGVLAFMCRPSRWKKQKKRHASLPARWEISRPIVHVDDLHEKPVPAPFTDVEKAAPETEEHEHSTPEQPPQLSLSLSRGRDSRPRHSKARQSMVSTLRGSAYPPQRLSAVSSLGDGEDAILTEFNRSTSWGYMSDDTHTPHDSMKVPTEMARVSKQVGGSVPESPTPTKARHHRSMFVYRDPSEANPEAELSNAAHRILGHGRSYSTCPGSSITSYGAESNDVPPTTPSKHGSAPHLSTPAKGREMLRLSETPPPPPLPLHLNKNKTNLSLTSTERRRSVRLVSNDGPTASKAKDQPKARDRRDHVQKRDSFLLKRRRGSHSPFFGSSAEGSSRRTSGARNSQLNIRRSRIFDFGSTSIISDLREEKPSEDHIGEYEIETKEEAKPEESTSDKYGELKRFPNSLRTTRSRLRSSVFRPFAEGFPRPVRSPSRRSATARGNSKRSLRTFRSSWASSRRFEDADEDSGSAYSQDQPLKRVPNTTDVPADASQVLSSQFSMDPDDADAMSGVLLTSQSRQFRSAAPSPTRSRYFNVGSTASESTNSSVSMGTKSVRNQRQSTSTRLGLGLNLEALLPELVDGGDDDAPGLPRWSSRRVEPRPPSETRAGLDDDMNATVSTGWVSQARRSRTAAAQGGARDDADRPRLPLSAVSSGAFQSQARALNSSASVFEPAYGDLSSPAANEGARLMRGRGKRPISVDGANVRQNGGGSLKGEVGVSRFDLGLGFEAHGGEGDDDAVRGNEAFI